MIVSTLNYTIRRICIVDNLILILKELKRFKNKKKNYL